MGCNLVVGANSFAHLPNRQIYRANLSPEQPVFFESDRLAKSRSVFLMVNIQGLGI